MTMGVGRGGNVGTMMGGSVGNGSIVGNGPTVGGASVGKTGTADPDGRGTTTEVGEGSGTGEDRGGTNDGPGDGVATAGTVGDAIGVASVSMTASLANPPTQRKVTRLSAAIPLSPAAVGPSRRREESSSPAKHTLQRVPGGMVGPYVPPPSRLQGMCSYRTPPESMAR